MADPGPSKKEGKYSDLDGGERKGRRERRKEERTAGRGKEERTERGEKNEREKEGGERW